MTSIPSAKAKLCISVSMQPGSFGTIVHNAGYRALGLDYIYKAFGTKDIANAIAGVRALNIRGCSVSMPFKETVIKYLDSIDGVAKDVEAVNTVVNDGGHLKGFNTDVVGAMLSLSPYLSGNSPSVLILGGGGVARAILQAIKQLGCHDVTVCVRDITKGENIALKFGAKLVNWESRHDVNANVLINATPIGMQPEIDELPIDILRFKTLEVVMDVVNMPVETKLIQAARKHKIAFINGLTLALNQAYEQFYLYTGVTAPRDAMLKAINGEN